MESRKEYLNSERDLWFGVWVALAIITALAIWRLRDFPYHLSWVDAWHGMSAVWPSTLWATFRIWIFWAISSAVLTGLILRIDPEIELLDAILGGAGGLWALGYFLGVILGPVAMFNTATLWALLALGVVWLWFHPPAIPPLRPSTGAKLALLAMVLLAVSMLPMQLASPVAPFMDVLAVPSSVQRIITFGVYLPFDNAAYGIWGPAAQTPGLELFLAMLGLGADLHEGAGALAQSQAMMPICALLIFACWRLGKSLFGDGAGGFAALFLFWTCLFRRAQGVRGTANDFALIGLGLAFFLNQSHRRTLIALGAMILGTAIASHSLNGGFAMVIASAAVLFWLLEKNYRRFLAGIGCLAGAALIAVPDVVVAAAHPVHYVVLAAAIISGITLIVFSCENLPQTSQVGNPNALRVLNTILVTLFVFALFARQSQERFSLFHKVAENLPLLSVICFAGIVATIATWWSDDQTSIPYASLAVVALGLLFAGEYIDQLAHMPQYQSSNMVMLWDVAIKLWDYWVPYFLVFPAGFAVSLAYERWSRPITFFLLMTLLIYPWYQINEPVDYDSVQHSITEQWAFNLDTATHGYWAGHSDRRWTFGGNERQVIDTLQNEIAAGRITTATHILHVARDTSSWSLLQFPILTGIDDDPIEFDHHPDNLYQKGGRVRGIDDFDAAIAARPPYILFQTAPPGSAGNWSDGYDLILISGYARLYRRRDLLAAPTNRHPLRDNLAAIAAILAIAVVVYRGRSRGK